MAQDKVDFYAEEGFLNLTEALIEQALKEITKGGPDAELERNWLNSQIGQGCLQVAIPSIDSELVSAKVCGDSAAAGRLLSLMRNEGARGVRVSASQVNPAILSAIPDVDVEEGALVTGGEEAPEEPQAASA